MQDVPIDRLRADWTAHAAEHGLTLDVVEDLLGHGSTREARVPAAARGPDRPRQHLGCAGLLRVLAKGQPTGARVAELEALAARTLADREIVKLPDAPAQAGVVEARYSTRDLLETEATDSPTRSPSSRRHRALASRATG